MHFKDEISTCWLTPSKKVFPVLKKKKADKNSVRQRANYYKNQTILQSSDDQTVYFGQCIFSRSTKNDPFVQSITNDDVLANTIRIC